MMSRNLPIVLWWMCSRGAACLAACLLLVACGTKAGTETDNPLHDESPEPPPYESPSRFNPEDPVPPGCVGFPDDTPPERGPYWTHTDSELVGVDRRWGLMVFDASAPPELRRLSATPLNGDVRALTSAGDIAFVVMDESPELATDVIPDADELATQLSLVPFDLSEPSAPERGDSLPLEGEFFALRERDGVVWVVTTRPEEREPSCQLPWAGCYFPSRVELIVTGYRAGEGELEPVASARLPMSMRAWMGRDGFLSLTSEYDEEQGRQVPLALHWARVDDTVLATGMDPDADPKLVTGSLELAAMPSDNAPVELVGERMFYFSQEDNGSPGTLHVVDVGTSEPTELVTVPDLPPGIDVGAFFGEDWVIVGSENFSRPGVVVELAEDGSASVTPLPDGYSMALPLVNAEASAPASSLPRLLAWGDITATGFLSLGLVDGSSGLAAGASLHNLQTTVAATGSVREGDPLYPGELAATEDGVGFLLRTFDDEQLDWVYGLGVVNLRESELELTTYDAESVDDEVVALGGAFFAPSALGIAAVDEQGTDVWFDLELREVEDVLPVSGGYVTLQWTWGGDRSVTRYDEDGAELGALVVPGGARRLVPVGENVGVLVEPRGHECEQMNGSDCDERSFLLVAPGAAPELLGSVDLPEAVQDAEGVEPPEGELIQLESGAWIFAQQQSETCLYVADCEARGITYRSLAEANVAVAQPTSPPCPEDETECPEPVPPPPPPEVYGTRTRLQLHRLDDSTPSAPRWVALSSSELELADSRFAPLRASGDVLLVTRMEVQLERGQSWLNAPARFMLQLVDGAGSGSAVSDTAASSDDTSDDTGGVDDEASVLQTSINIPGYAVAFVPKGVAFGGNGAGESVSGSEQGTAGKPASGGDARLGTIFSVEPGVDSEVVATFYRLRLEQNGAHVEAARPLAGRYGDLVVLNERAYYVRKGADGCSPAELQTIALDDDLEVLNGIELPETEWTFADGTDDALLLKGPAYALFDIAEASPQLTGFYGGRVLSESPRIFDGELWAAVWSYGVQHIDF